MIVFLAFLSALAAVVSAAAAWCAIRKANEQAKDRLRPLMVFDSVDTCLLLGEPAGDAVERRPAIVFKQLRNDGAGPAINLMYVFQFVRWKDPKEVQYYGGYFPNGRDYTRDTYPAYLPEQLRSAFETDTPAERPPDILIYYSDVFGRRFVTKSVWAKLAPEGPAELTAPQFEFSQVDERDHLLLPGADEEVTYLVRPPEDFHSKVIDLPAD